jgi:hypothetical protein
LASLKSLHGPGESQSDVLAKSEGGVGMKRELVSRTERPRP